MSKKTKEKKGSGGKDMRLSTRMALIIGLLVLAVMAVLSTCITVLSARALSDAVDAQMLSISEKNASTIQSVNESTENMANVIMVSQEAMNHRTDGTDSTRTSRVNGEEIYQKVYESETVLIRSLQAAVKSSDYIISAAAYFEKGGLPGTTEDYGAYMNKADAAAGTVQNIPYSTFSNGMAYPTVKNRQQAVITNSYVDNGDTIVSAGYPIMIDGEFRGAVVFNVSVDLFSGIDLKVDGYPSLFSNLLGTENFVLYSSKTQNIGKQYKDVVPAKAYEAMAQEQAKGAAFSVDSVSDSGQKVKRYLAPLEAGSDTWWVQTTVSNSDYNATRNRVIILAVILTIAFVFIFFLVVYRMVSTSLKPLSMISEAVESVANGNFDVNIEYSRHDEIGEMAKSIGNVISRIRKIIEDLQFKLKEISNCNLSVDLTRSQDDYVGSFRPLLTSMEDITNELNRTVSDIKQSSTQVNSGADQVSSASQALSQGATEQASSVQELSATMNDISHKIKHTAERAQEASDLSSSAGKAVDLSNAKMEEMSQAMREITEKSNEINKIIKTIDDIAFQTNILSLNAAIEAARAGSAGKGFAVVADEVGNLAQKSAEAAQNTAALIEETIEAVNKGAKITAETEEALLSVSESTNKVNELIADISKAFDEQSESVSQITIGLDQISSVVQTNSATAEESAAASEELSGQANIMNDLVSKFRLKGDPSGSASSSQTSSASRQSGSFAASSDDYNNYDDMNYNTPSMPTTFDNSKY